jgi:hypothetical protein
VFKGFLEAMAVLLIIAATYFAWNGIIDFAIKNVP